MQKNRGFTLIELLIVVMILGILAGVVLTVINPGAQQNKARDASVKATMDKIALAINSHYSSDGVYPGCSVMGRLINFPVYAYWGGETYCWINISSVSPSYTWLYYKGNSGCMITNAYFPGNYWVWWPGWADIRNQGWQCW